LIFYEQLERTYAACSNHDVKLVIGDANAKVGQETVHQSTIGKHSLHESTNENDLRLDDFAAGRKWLSKVRTSCTNKSIPPNLDLPRRTHFQPERSLLDRRKTLFRRYGVKRCKHRLKPHASRYKIENKNMPCQQHKAATTETFRSRQTEGKGRRITVLRRGVQLNN
jgi:hypothetical protein